MKLNLVNISKTYDDISVLNNVSCELRPGVYGLLGANGSGKTTLFRVLCGTIKATHGKILFNNRDVRNESDKFRSILGYLPQDFSYYPDFTGTKFMLYIAALKGLNKKIAKKKCNELLSIVGLEREKDKKIKTYSGGMKQRLGIAQSLINDPKILILDEPTVGLDPKERVKFRNLISSFSKNKIILLSTHIVSDVEYISDEILILKRGEIVNRGNAQKLRETICSYVWETDIAMENFDEMVERHIISNQRSNGSKTTVRIISMEKPSANSRQVEPTLEDLYLYYFREETMI